MYKFVLFSVLFALATARPGYLHGGHAYVAAPIAIPSAVSHSSRIDFHSHPVAVVKSAPLAVVKAAPVALVQQVHAPVAHLALPAAVSHSSRVDIHHSAPVVATYGLGYAHGGLLGHGLHGW